MRGFFRYFLVGSRFNGLENDFSRTVSRFSDFVEFLEQAFGDGGFPYIVAGYIIFADTVRILQVLKFDNSAFKEVLDVSEPGLVVIVRIT